MCLISKIFNNEYINWIETNIWLHLNSESMRKRVKKQRDAICSATADWAQWSSAWRERAIGTCCGFHIWKPKIHQKWFRFPVWSSVLCVSLSCVTWYQRVLICSFESAVLQWDRDRVVKDKTILRNLPALARDCQNVSCKWERGVSLQTKQEGWCSYKASAS